MLLYLPSPHPLMLPFTSPKEAILACPPSPLWNVLSFRVEPTLSSSCSRSDPPSLTKVQLSLTLTLFPLTIWCCQQTALFFFLLARVGLAPCQRVANCSLSVALRPLFPFQQAQYAQVFLLNSASFCKLVASLSSTNKSVTSLLLLSDSHSVLATLSSPPSFLSSQTLWQIWQELSSLSSCSIRLQWVPGHSFLLGNGAADELARRRVLLVPSAIPCSLSLISTLLFSQTLRRIVSLKFFNTQVPSISTKEPVLPHCACCVFSRLCCNRHSLLLSSYLSRIDIILAAAPVDTHPRHLSSHSALYSYGLFAPLALWRLCVSVRPLVQALWSFLASGAPWSSAMPSSLGRGRVTKTSYAI